MLCRRCMSVMRSGTAYGRKKSSGEYEARRFCECMKCHDKFYTRDLNSQEYLKREAEKRVDNHKPVKERGYQNETNNRTNRNTGRYAANNNCVLHRWCKTVI